MIFNNPNQISNNNTKVIIIGSGPAGLTLAKSLEDKKISCLILEAGDLETSINSQEYYQGSIMSENYLDISSSRLRQFGGTSNHWGKVCQPLEHKDFDRWLINRNSLNQYSDRSKKILKIKDDFYIKKFNDNFNIYKALSAEIDFKETFYNQIKKSKYMHLLLNSNVVEFYNKESRINKIKFFFKNKAYFLNSNFFVLSAGAIENCRLLLWYQKKNGFINNTMPIGNYYMDHPTHDSGEGIIFVENFNKYLKKNKISKFINLNCDHWLYLSPNKNFIKKNNITASRVDIYYQPYASRSDYYNRIVRNLVCVAPSLSKNFLKNYKKQLAIRIEMHSDQEPAQENKIILDMKKKDNFGIPRVKLFWQRDDKIRKSSKIILSNLANFFVKENIGRIAIKKYLFNNDKFINQGGYHHIGGTIMGKNSKDSVVDKNLKVHDIDNLYIAGSSVFPSAGIANPTFTIVQLSIRLADEIHKKFI